MKIRFAFLLLLLCHCCVVAQSGFQFDTEKNKVVIPFQLINNLIFIPVTVNGVPLNFLLDSGVEETILLSLEDKTELSIKNVMKVKLRGLGSEEAIEGLKSSNNELSFNGLVDRHHDLYVVLDQSFNFSSHIGIPVNGIIGYHFFKDNLVEINYDKKKIIVYKDIASQRKKINKRFTALPITIEKKKPYLMTNVILEEHEIDTKVLVDIGNSDAIWLFENPLRGIKIPKHKFADYLGKGFSGDINGYRSKIETLKLGEFEFTHPIIAFPDSLSIKNVNMVPNRAGSIGGEILKRFNVVFDYAHQKMLLRKSRYYTDHFSYNMSGIELQNEGLQWVQETVALQTVPDAVSFGSTDEKVENNFRYKFTLKPVYTIANIRKDSPADLCGLLKGDVILSINRFKAYHYTLQSINDLLKSEEGKWFVFEVERNGKPLKFSFQLKSML